MQSRVERERERNGREIAKDGTVSLGRIREVRGGKDVYRRKRERERKE